MTNIDPEVIERSLRLIIDTYKEFRDELMASYGNIEFTRKSDDSQLTVLDTKVETVLKERLKKEFPEFGFRGEETGTSGSTDAFWLVDPIDGTTSFIRGLPNCSNMAALVIDRQPVAAVIYNFPLDELFTAVAGGGAFKNGLPIYVSDRPINNSFLDNLRSSAYKDIYTLMPPGVRTLQPLGAAGRSFSLTAEGKLDGTINLGGEAAMHDRVPGALIIKEAGGELVSFEPGGEWTIDTQSYIAAAPRLAEFFRSKQKAIEEIISRYAH